MMMKNHFSARLHLCIQAIWFSRDHTKLTVLVIFADLALLCLSLSSIFLYSSFNT